MEIPDWNQWQLLDGALRESSLDPRQFVIWLSGARDGAVQRWQRVSNVPGALITFADGIGSTPATALTAEERLQGFVGKLWSRMRKTTRGPMWVVPGGADAEQVGPRRNDLLLVWRADESVPLDEALVKATWPDSTEVRRLCNEVYLVSGVGAAASGAERSLPNSVQSAAGAGVRGMAGASGAAPAEDPRTEAESLVTKARLSGDRRSEASALTDLGVLCTRLGDARRAVTVLEEALVIVQEFGDKARESDVLGNLGLAVLGAGDPGRALGLVQQALEAARASGDRYEEKLAVERLGRAYSGMRSRAQALEAFRQAIDLAREFGDRPHEAELHWHLATEYAELGVQNQALASGQEAVQLFESMGKPQGRFLAEHLAQFRQGGGSAGRGASALPGVDFSAFMATGAAPRLMSNSTPADGPGIMRMAFTALKSMGRFIGSGLKVVTPEVRLRRLETCAACEHHTGLRCRLCGCFTNAKTWLPHEDCPIGKWPS